MQRHSWKGKALLPCAGDTGRALREKPQQTAINNWGRREGWMWIMGWRFNNTLLCLQ